MGARNGEQRDAGRRDLEPLGVDARSDRDAEAAEVARHTEHVEVGDVVADRDGYAAAIRRLLHECADRRALVGTLDNPLCGADGGDRGPRVDLDGTARDQPAEQPRDPPQQAEERRQVFRAVDGEPALQWIAARFNGEPTAPNCGHFP